VRRDGPGDEGRGVVSKAVQKRRRAVGLSSGLYGRGWSAIIETSTFSPRSFSAEGLPIMGYLGLGEIVHGSSMLYQLMATTGYKDGMNLLRSSAFLLPLLISFTSLSLLCQTLLNANKGKRLAVLER